MAKIRDAGSAPGGEVAWSESRPRHLHAVDDESAKTSNKGDRAADAHDPERSETIRPAPAQRAAPPQQRPAARSRAWLWIGLVVVVAALASWWWLHRSAGKPPSGSAQGSANAQPRVPVGAAQVATRDLPIYFEGLGTVQAFNSVTVRSRVDGEVTQIAFEEGQTVRKGDLLAQIDPRPYQAALDQATAKKKQDEATLASNKLDLGRTTNLAKSAFATQQQLDQQTATVAAQTALIAADQAQIENAQTQLGYTTIRAPLDGRLGIRLVDQGNIVRASDQTGIVDIAQLRPISVVFTAPESQLPAIQDAKKRGDVPVVAMSSDGKQELGRGTLALINNTVDAASGTVRMKATFANGDDRLWPGLSVNTRLLAETRSQAAVVPADAIQRGTSDLYVFAIDKDGKAQKRVVKVGPFSEGVAQILDGLQAGETVVTSGQSRLAEGSPVAVQNGTPSQREAAKPGNERAAQSAGGPAK